MCGNVTKGKSQTVTDSRPLDNRIDNRSNRGPREAKEVRRRGAAKLGRETSLKKLPIAECDALRSID